jgi:hypothetical protein
MSTSQNQLFGELQTLNASLAVNAPDLPEMEITRLYFDSLVLQMQEAATRQAILTSSKQEATRQLQNVMAEASRVATLLRQGVKVHYGIEAEKLNEFGMQPFRGRKRRSKPAPGDPGPSGE